MSARYLDVHEYDEWLRQRTESVLGRPLEQPRRVQLPPRSLCNTQATARKMGPAAVCRMCLRPQQVRPHSVLTRHHIVPEAWFRQQLPHVKAIRHSFANIVPLCRPCHDLVESRDDFTRTTARRHLRRSMTQQEVAFVIALRGQQWLDHHYPRDARQ